MSITIYLAAPWAHKDEAKQVRTQFEANGIKVNSRWLDYHGQSGSEWDPEVLEREAIHDIEDICAADGMVVLHYKVSEGKSFEQGFFLGISAQMGKTKKMVLVIPPDFGPSRNVFHYIRDIYQTVDNVDAAIALVKEWENDGRDTDRDDSYA